MRPVAFIATILFTLPFAFGQTDFSGTWNLNASLSDMRGLPAPADPVMKVEQTASALSVGLAVYPLDGSVARRKTEASFDTRTKWEGSALLANILVSGPQDYTIMERWTRSRDGQTLTIRRTFVRMNSERESTLVYQLIGSPEAAAPVATAVLERRPPPPTPAVEYTVETGTRLLLRLTNSIDTKHSSPGDRIYLETVVPLFVSEHLVIPRGSIVIGVVTDAQKAGRVKGKSALTLRFDSLTLPNGVARDFRSLPGQVDGHGNLDKSEGTLHGDGHKGGDARTVGETTAAGTGIGGAVGAASGHLGAGLGIGAAAGAAAGLAGVLGSRGPDVILRPGTTMELVLDRDLHYTREEAQHRIP